MDIIGAGDTWLSVLNVVGVWLAAAGTIWVALRSISIQTKQKLLFKHNINRIITVSAGLANDQRPPGSVDYALGLLITNCGYQPINILSLHISFENQKGEWLYGYGLQIPRSPLMHGDCHHIEAALTDFPEHVKDKIRGKQAKRPVWSVQTSIGKLHKVRPPRRAWKEICKTI